MSRGGKKARRCPSETGKRLDKQGETGGRSWKKSRVDLEGRKVTGAGGASLTGRSRREQKGNEPWRARWGAGSRRRGRGSRGSRRNKSSVCLDGLEWIRKSENESVDGGERRARYKPS